MTKLHLAAALLAVAIAGPVAAQNVQDKNAPQNPKDVTPASPSGQGATGDTSGQAGTMDQKKSAHKRKHTGAKKTPETGDTGSTGTTDKK
jgi:opacity protein-like surface antigen